MTVKEQKRKEEYNKREDVIKRQERIMELARKEGVRFFTDVVKENGDVLLPYNTTKPQQYNGYPTMTVFDYSVQNNSPVGSHRFYCDYYVVLTSKGE